MILYNPTKSAEHAIRIAYVNSESFSYKDYNGYRQYVLDNIPGVIEVGYWGGDNPDHIESLVFDNDEHLAWFILRWS